VAKDGSGQYTRISDAAAAAQPGYEILVKAGTYNEKVTPGVSGTDTAYITFRAQQSGTAVITNANGPCIDVSGVNYLKFIGLKLDRCNAAIVSSFGPTLSGALQIQGPSHHIVVDGVAITSSTGSGVYMIGVGSNTVHDITVQNSTISNSVGHGVFIYRACDHIKVEHNTILHSGNDDPNADGFGLEIRQDDSNLTNDGGREPRYISVTNNEVGYSSFQGARTWNVDHVLFQGNYIHHSGATGIQIESGTHFCILDGNRVEHNSWTGRYVSETGIWIDRSTDCVVRNNRSTANNIGIWVGDDNDRVIVRNNISYLNDGSTTQDFPEGIKVNGDPHPPPDSQYVTLVHNTMYKNGNNNSQSYNLVLSTPGSDPADASKVSTNVVLNNIVSDVVGATNVSAATGYTMSNGCYWNPAVSGPGDNAAITQNPLFVNAAGADFRLQPGSPCIDKGAFLTHATTSGSGTSLTVADARYFSDGYGITAGDVIRVGSSTATITRVSGNTLTLDQSITWSAGAPVTYPYTGSAPDIGALESQ
jgi:parallel beta-helix repeat protein